MKALLALRECKEVSKASGQPYGAACPSKLNFAPQRFYFLTSFAIFHRLALL